jgi:hypothetical protein
MRGIGWSSSIDKPGKLTIVEVGGYDMLAHIRALTNSWPSLKKKERHDDT